MAEWEWVRAEGSPRDDLVLVVDGMRTRYVTVISPAYRRSSLIRKQVTRLGALDGTLSSSSPGSSPESGRRPSRR